MRRTAIPTALLAALALGITGCATTSGPTGDATASSASTGTPAYAATMEQQLRDVMAANAIPGVEVLIRSRDGGDWQTTLGTAEAGAEVPMPANGFFRIGSNTKTMTSTVLLQLAQEGKLSLEDPIARYVPDVPNGDLITLTDLSSMRSGLFSYTADAGFNATLDAEPQKSWTPQELLDIAFSHSPNAAPDTEYEYSNTNIVLLGLVIEKVTRQSATDAFTERLFAPLGLRDTSLPLPQDSGALPDPHAQGYQFGTNVEDLDSYAVPDDQLSAALAGTLAPINNTDMNPSWAWTAGGATSTPTDLATYVEAMVDGGLLDEQYQKLRLASGKPIGGGGATTPSYGLGIVEFVPGLFGHDGQLPGYSSFMARDTDRGITIILAANLSASPVTGENAAVVLGKAVIAELYGADAVPGGDPAGASSASPSSS